MQEPVVTPHMEMMLELEEFGIRDRIKILTGEEEERLVRLFKSRFPKDFPYDGAILSDRRKPVGDDQDYFSQHRSFFQEAIKITGSGDDDIVTVLWDDMDYPSLEVPVGILQKHLDVFVSVTHSYIMPSDARWCICYKTSSYMGFGLASAP